MSLVSRFTCFVIAVFLALPARTNDGPIGVGNGGGESEYSIVFAKSNLVNLLKDCANYVCVLTHEEHVLLYQLTVAAIDHPTTLKFVNSQSLGNRLYDFFEDNVLVNQDLLWLDQAKTIPYATSDAISFWLEVFAEKIQVTNPLLKSLQLKVRASMQKSVTRGHYDAPNSRTFEFLKWSRPEAPDVLVMRDPGLQTINVTEIVSQRLNCQSDLRLQLFSPGWVPVGVPMPNEEVVLALNFGIKWECDQKSGFSDARVIVTSTPNEISGLAFDKSSVILQLD